MRLVGPMGGPGSSTRSTTTRPEPASETPEQPGQETPEVPAVPETEESAAPAQA
ncbi:hypothetical protein Ocin01_17506 [Orchesella cincta]|uniref:Uncharacterized protein n=1 Tax=Orchesella cincta TaxID=48709 RepID=A0A1D2M866_ORCCI|nr:hypothetical protein Ocin01_17506 [Orchesella cincta]